MLKKYLAGFFLGAHTGQTVSRHVDSPVLLVLKHTFSEQMDVYSMKDIKSSTVI